MNLHQTIDQLTDTLDIAVKCITHLEKITDDLRKRVEQLENPTHEPGVHVPLA